MSTACSSSHASKTAPKTAVPELASATAAVQVIVSGLQLDLQQLGHDPGDVSGRFDARTKIALEKFQRDATVPSAESGLLGPATASALEARLPGASEVVRALQSALTDVGVFKGTINGRYGADTLNAVKAVQRKAGLVADGYIGPETAAAFLRLYAQKVPEPTPSGPVTTEPDATGALLKLGSTGADVTRLQQRLRLLGYRPGSNDGTYQAATAGAVLAFQKSEGLARDGTAGPSVQAALASPHGAGPRSGLAVPRIEVDIARQIAFVVLADQSVTILNISSGNGETYKVPGGGTDVADTPVGSFTVERKIQGDEKAPLGTLHSPLYFYKGWAVHGSASVPAYPASHGCVRVSNVDADWLFPLVPVRTAVVLYDTTGRSPGPKGLPSNAAGGF